jgi:hypothetical protein
MSFDPLLANGRHLQASRVQLEQTQGELYQSMAIAGV